MVGGAPKHWLMNFITCKYIYEILDFVLASEGSKYHKYNLTRVIQLLQMIIAEVKNDLDNKVVKSYKYKIIV